jgi:hypothetical protein
MTFCFDLNSPLPLAFPSHLRSESRLKYPESNQYPSWYGGDFGYEYYTFEYMEEGWQDWEKKFEVVFPS